MMTDSFIENVISPKSEQEKATMNREFYGMIEVQHTESREDTEQNGGDNE